MNNSLLIWKIACASPVSTNDKLLNMNRFHVEQLWRVVSLLMALIFKLTRYVTSFFFPQEYGNRKATSHGILSLQSWPSGFSELLMQVFADHKSSHNPIYVVREQLWNLQRRMVYFGTSVPSIFKGYDQHTSPIQRNLICNSTNTSYFLYIGLTTEEIQECF